MLTAGLLVVLGIGVILFIDNLVKKIIGAMFVTDGANLLLVSIGYREGGIVPILPEKLGDVVCQYPDLSKECVAGFASVAGYPLPYALVLTNIVIGAATVAVMLGLVMKLHKKHGSLSTAAVLGGDDDD